MTKEYEKLKERIGNELPEYRLSEDPPFQNDSGVMFLDLLKGDTLCVVVQYSALLWGNDAFGISDIAGDSESGSNYTTQPERIIHSVEAAIAHIKSLSC